MAQTYAQYINCQMDWLVNYINHIVDFNNSYNNAIKELCSKSNVDNITKSEEIIRYEKEMKTSYDKAMELYKDLELIIQHYKWGMNIDYEIQAFNNRLQMTRLPIYENMTLEMKPGQNSNIGVPTGAAAMPTNPNKADFSDMAQHNWNMRKNMSLNANNPDAQELANIFLGNPQNAPYSEEYKYLPARAGEILNSKYNLYKTNKEINKNWSGFAYSKYSTLAKNVSNYPYLKTQLLKYYNGTTNKFDSNKIDVNFDKDKNLYLALGHATILDPTIDEHGYFHGILFDKYDFDLKYKDIYDDTFNTLAIDYFWLLQEIFKNKNFYILAPVKFKW